VHDHYRNDGRRLLIFQFHDGARLAALSAAPESCSEAAG
jgi:hypothetical protein